MPFNQIDQYKWAMQIRLESWQNMTSARSHALRFKVSEENISEQIIQLVVLPSSSSFFCTSRSVLCVWCFFHFIGGTVELQWSVWM